MAFRLENVRKNSGITGLDKATPANKNQDGPPDAPKRSGLNVNVGVEVDACVVIGQGTDHAHRVGSCKLC